MTCKFNIGQCNINCPKYNICMYFELQKQITELTEHVNLLMNILNSLDPYMRDNKKGTGNHEDQTQHP
jgi:hypothetical protein